jgi:hypothetical protein
MMIGYNGAVRFCCIDINATASAKSASYFFNTLYGTAGAQQPPPRQA